MAIVGLTDTGVIDLLRNSPYAFYLGGSRRMSQIEDERAAANGTDVTGLKVIKVTTDTDWDFYATYTPELEQWLSNNRFTHTECSLGAKHVWEGYLDDEAISILERDNVQVVLRKDAEFYQQIFENIKIDVYYNFLWKSSPAIVDKSKIQTLFNQLFTIGRAFKQGDK